MPEEKVSPILRFIRKIAADGETAGLSDRQLLERFIARRDEAAFAALLSRHGPLVLCYLQGKSNDQAAELLGCPKATLATRLMRARDLLRPRLVRRGLAETASTLAGMLSQGTASASVPALLAQSTTQAAFTFAA